MFSISEQISAVAKTTLGNPIAVLNALSKTAFVSIEKIIALNMQTVKQSLENSTNTTRELFAANKAQELFSFGAVQAQPQIEKIVAYGRELADISAQARHEFLFNLTNTNEEITTVISRPVAKPADSTPVAKPVKKTSAKTQNTQLPLLVEAEVKIAKKPATKTKKVVAVSKTSPVVPPVEMAAVTAKPVEVAAKIAVKKSVEPKKSETAPVVKAAIKSAEKELDTKPVVAKTEIVSPVETTPATPATPAAQSPVEKKTAVKMPFPASPIKKAAKPAFPTVATRPAYKAKGSAATGAKKPVRQ